jgi:hypothetical protein
MTQSTQPPVVETDIDCIVAAILTVAACGAAGMYPDEVVKRYAKLLDHLRAVGGHLNPARPP